MGKFSSTALEENLPEQILRWLKNDVIQSKLFTQFEELTFKNVVEQARTLQNTGNLVIELENKNFNLNKVSVNKNTKQNYTESKFMNQSQSNNISKTAHSNVNEENLKCFCSRGAS